MKLVVDWDGTVTERDTLMHVLRYFVAPAVLDPLEAELDAGLAAGTITHREVMEREWAQMTAPLALRSARGGPHLRTRRPCPLSRRRGCALRAVHRLSRARWGRVATGSRFMVSWRHDRPNESSYDR